MPHFSAAQLDSVVRGVASGVAAGARAAGAFAASPPFLQKQADAATRVGQWMAALILPVIIIVNLALIVALNGIMASVLGATGDLGTQADLFSFLVTGITLGVFIMCAWAWFQFVRTAGFGMFALGD